MQLVYVPQELMRSFEGLSIPSGRARPRPDVDTPRAEPDPETHQRNMARPFQPCFAGPFNTWTDGRIRKMEEIPSIYDAQ